MSHPTITECAIVFAALKFLLFPAYRSTDFEVHRNWLAITYSLSPKEWYLESTSEWTLDYPPFFAYFEYLLSQVARFFDPRMLDVRNLGYESWSTVALQRTSILVTELLLVCSLNRYLCSSSSSSGAQSRKLAAALSILLSPAILIIDAIHFQYNGALYGLLVLSLVLARREDTLLLSGFVFATLLCFKHIFLYLAPAYFAFLLRAYCLSLDTKYLVNLSHCVKLGSGILVIASVAFGPFIYFGQLTQLRSRLFPFSRSLCHAYWAPNAWALYYGLDRMLLLASSRLGLAVKSHALESGTRGIVGATAFAVLPEITPRATFLLTLAVQMLAMSRVMWRPSWQRFIETVTHCAYAAFLFGWHVHEKAVVLVIIPFSLIALDDRRYLSAFRPLAVAGHISLFPLLFTPAEFPVKVTYTVLWLMVFLYAFNKLAPPSSNRRYFVLDRLSFIYTVSAIPLLTYTSALHEVIFRDKLQYLPLMLISLWSAVGIIASWLGFWAVTLLGVPDGRTRGKVNHAANVH